MPTDNVIPINSRVHLPGRAGTSERTPARFRWFVAALTVVWAGALTAALIFTPFPALWPLLVLAVLVVAAEHRFVLFGDETSMSASIVVILCAVTFWRNDAYLVGPMLIATCGGFLYTLVRDRALTKVLANSTGMSLAAGAGSLVVHLSTGLPHRYMSLTLALALGSITYWSVNNAVVARFVSDTSGGRFSRILWNLIVSDFGLVLFAFLASAIVGCSEFSQFSKLLCIGLLALASTANSAAQGPSPRPDRIAQNAIPSLSIAVLGLLVAANLHETTWSALTVLAVVIICAAAPGTFLSEYSGSPILSLLLILLVLSANPLVCLVSAAAAVAFVWRSRRHRKEFAVLASVSLVLSHSDLSQSHRIAISILWCIGICAFITIAPRLITVFPATHLLGVRLMLGVATPGRDDLLMAILVVPLAITLEANVGISTSIAAVIVGVTLALPAIRTRNGGFLHRRHDA